MGFQTAKRSAKQGKAGLYEFRKAMETFKADFGVPKEDIAGKFMAMVTKDLVSREELAEALKSNPPQVVLHNLQNSV